MSAGNSTTRTPPAADGQASRPAPRARAAAAVAASSHAPASGAHRSEAIRHAPSADLTPTGWRSQTGAGPASARSASIRPPDASARSRWVTASPSDPARHATAIWRAPSPVAGSPACTRTDESRPQLSNTTPAWDCIRSVNSARNPARSRAAKASASRVTRSEATGSEGTGSHAAPPGARAHPARTPVAAAPSRARRLQDMPEA